MSNGEKVKTPFIRIAKREKQNPWIQFGLYFGAVLLALAVGAVMLSALKVNFLTFYKNMFTLGAIGNKFAYKAFESYIRIFVPLLVTSLGLSLAFKMRFWNIGGEGQFIVGAITASAIALGINANLSPYLMVLIMGIGGGIAGGVYGFVVAVLKVKFGTNETLLTLMLNYVALYLLKFFGETQGEWNIFLSRESMRPVFAKFGASGQMPTIPLGDFSLNLSLIFGLALVAFIYVYLNKTKHGFEINVIGDSPNTARYAGMRVNGVVLRTMFFSAFLIGLAGAFKTASAGVLSTTITADVGWTGIVIAWLAKLNPIGVLVTTALITILQYGCQVASTSFSAIDVNFASLLQGIILFVVLASDFFIKFKIVIRKKDAKSVGGNSVTVEAPTEQALTEPAVEKE